jgi:carbon storage regulator CsrA
VVGQKNFEDKTMLVLSRKNHQSVIIGRDIKVEVVSIRGNRVRLGIAAPKSVAVHREEIAEKIESERFLKQLQHRLTAALLRLRLKLHRK